MAPSRKRIDPGLLSQLASVAGGGPAGPIQAIIRLRVGEAGAALPAPERVEKVVRSLMGRVTRKLGLKPTDFHVFPQLGSFVISASREYLRELLDQPEVQGALANRPRRAAPGTPSRRSPSPRRPLPR